MVGNSHLDMMANITRKEKWCTLAIITKIVCIGKNFDLFSFDELNDHFTITTRMNVKWNEIFTIFSTMVRIAKFENLFE